MTHQITRPRQFTGTEAQAARMEARRLQALRNLQWQREHEELESSSARVNR